MYTTLKLLYNSSITCDSLFNIIGFLYITLKFQAICNYLNIILQINNTVVICMELSTTLSRHNGAKKAGMPHHAYGYMYKT